MLSKEDNEILCRVGPGTLMGNLLRRYWTPALLTSEIPEPDCPPVDVRILGEDLVAFRDTYGRVGLVAKSCPHRGASMFYGRNEECGLRCVYHGWKFDVEGNCVDMPSEPADTRFKEKVKIESYPTHESGGVVWTYMGPPETITGFRDFGSEGVPPEQWQATKSIAYCNWVQRMEGNIDTSHISWLHQYDGPLQFPDDGTDRPGYPSYDMSWKFWAHDRAPRLDIEDTWFGYRYAGIRTTPNGHTHVRITAYAVPYTTVVASIPFATGGSMCVPIDDESCYFFRFSTRPQPNEQARQKVMRESGEAGLFGNTPYAPGMRRRFAAGIDQREFTPENRYQIDRELQKNGGSFTGITDFVSQDLAVTESMGPIYDRTKEHLGTTDKAIIRMRQILLKAAKDLAHEIEPPALDPSLPYAQIRSAEKVLAPGEDWRSVGSDEDPLVIEASYMPRAQVAALTD